MFGFALSSCVLNACEAPPPPRPLVTTTAADEIKKLPAPLRERFDTKAGHDEMERALADKALLLKEARRRNLDKADDVRSQVQALEDRLAIQALMREEKAKPATEEELRSFYESQRDALSLPERVSIRRLFVAPHGDDAEAKKRAAALLSRLDKGEDWTVLVKESDGPERVRNGDYGAIAKDNSDEQLARAAFALEPGKHSGVVATKGGYSILVCDRRLPARVPPFEEVRAEVENRYQPTLERRTFDQLLKKLRAEEAAR